MITFRALTGSDARKIEDIDRSEHVTLGYRFQGGVLEEEEVDWHIPRWTENAVAEFNISERITEFQSKIAKGDRVIGAFDADLLVGFAVLRVKLTEDMAQLSELFVSREYRRRGIASELVSEMIALARASKAARLYVSSVPSESAVGFYLNQGFQPTQEVHPHLFELEPEDIHMTLDL